MGINRIGIDLHGVIDDNPDLFRELLETIFFTHIEVYIISGPPMEEIKQELERCGLEEDFHYQKIISIVDYLKSKGIPMWLDEKGTWWADDESWWNSKAEICEAESIDLMIDDKKKYGEAFKSIKTKFLLYTN